MSIKLTKNQLISSCIKEGIVLDSSIKYKNRDLIKLLGEAFLSGLDKEDLSWGLDRRLELESLSLCYRYDELKPDMQDELWDSNDYIAESKLNGCRILLAYHPEEGFRFFSRHVSVQDYLPIDYSNNIFLRGFNETLEKYFSGTGVPFRQNSFYLLGKDYRSLSLGGIFSAPFILDCEIVASGNVNTNELLKYGGNITESEQNATSTLLSLSPDTSKRIQLDQNVILQFYPFDILYLGDGWVKDLPYKDRYIYLGRVKSELKKFFDVIDVPRYLTKEEKELAWQHQLANKGEGLVFKNINKSYQATEARKNDVQIKLKRSMSNGSVEKGEDIDAFISGFVKPDPKRGLAEYIGGIKFSVIMRTLDGEEVEHHLATVSGIPLELRKVMTVLDASGKPELNPDYLNKVCVIDGMSISPKSLRFSHARSKFDFRSDKTKYDCVLSELFLRSNII